jgi:hypothetical protein
MNLAITYIMLNLSGCVKTGLGDKNSSEYDKYPSSSFPCVSGENMSNARINRVTKTTNRMNLV